MSTNRIATPKFASTSQSFHSELKKRINSYFNEEGKSFTGGYRIYTKAAILITAFIGLYIHLVFFTPPVLWALLECVLLGLTVASIGFNVMHDGGHGSFSKKQRLNNAAGLSMKL